MPRRRTHQQLPKVVTGIDGFDEITGGGLPKGRPTLVCGGPGCGKTLFSLQFLMYGAEHGEPGVFVAFEETGDDLLKNVRSLGYDLESFVKRKKIAIEYVRVERAEIEETGEYDLEGLFIRLNDSIQRTGAKRVVIDSVETLFAGLQDSGVLRSELRRLFVWLKDRGLTAICTGEKGIETLTRHGLEEYVSDCVIALDHRVTAQISTRRLRIVKYRGSAHGTNEYPFLIDDDGIVVLPITSLQLVHNASMERVSTGLPWLDQMFGGKGWFRGSSILMSGAAGTAKTTLASHFLDAACRRGERA
ncbi:MAG TPA: circadian clock protein KaiC, partial [Vicinamibacterales bacterium]|nr:circadian clock protein KaiC [Vicinamibacterales bacterium]